MKEFAGCLLSLFPILNHGFTPGLNGVVQDEGMGQVEQSKFLVHRYGTRTQYDMHILTVDPDSAWTLLTEKKDPSELLIF